MKRPGLALRYLACLAARMDTGEVEGFVGVDVAHARDPLLIE